MCDVLCTICRKPITDSDFQNKRVADLHVWKLGELDSILLAHAHCANTDDSEARWNIPEPQSPAEPGMKWVRNLRSGRWIQIEVDTPRCCDPSTELYWAM